MISFYPGPSRIYNTIPQYLQDACDSGILSENHRSDAFVAVSQKCIELLKEKLLIPKDYWVFFTSSATEGWHIAANSFKNFKACHVYNGAFGEKWFEATVQLKGPQHKYQFDKEEEVDIDRIPRSSEIIALTHNETSNGTALSNNLIQAIRTNFPESLVFVDATSSLGGVALEIGNADVWLSSVQKCFGLPAGLGILICSPAAIEKAGLFGNRFEYNSLLNLEDKMKTWQTPYTPNVLGIYLLSRVAGQIPVISQTELILKERANSYYEFFASAGKCSLLVKNTQVRSSTVIALESSGETISEIKIKARDHNLILGNGYGKLAKSTFRIANFPAILDHEIVLLKDFIKGFAR